MSIGDAHAGLTLPDVSRDFWKVQRACLIGGFGSMTLVMLWQWQRKAWMRKEADKGKSQTKRSRASVPEKIAMGSAFACLFLMLMWIGNAGVVYLEHSEATIRINLVLTMLGYSVGLAFNFFLSNVWLKQMQDLVLLSNKFGGSSKNDRDMPMWAKAGRILSSAPHWVGAVLCSSVACVVAMVSPIESVIGEFHFMRLFRVLYGFDSLTLVGLVLSNEHFGQKAQEVFGSMSRSAQDSSGNARQKQGDSDASVWRKMKRKARIFYLFTKVNASVVIIFGVILCGTTLVYDPVMFEVIVSYFCIIQLLFTVMLLFVVVRPHSQAASAKASKKRKSSAVAPSTMARSTTVTTVNNQIQKMATSLPPTIPEVPRTLWQVLGILQMTGFTAYGLAMAKAWHEMRSARLEKWKRSIEARMAAKVTVAERVAGRCALACGFMVLAWIPGNMGVQKPELSEARLRINLIAATVGYTIALACCYDTSRFWIKQLQELLLVQALGATQQFKSAKGRGRERALQGTKRIVAFLVATPHWIGSLVASMCAIVIAFASPLEVVLNDFNFPTIIRSARATNMEREAEAKDVSGDNSGPRAKLAAIDTSLRRNQTKILSVVRPPCGPRSAAEARSVVAGTSIRRADLSGLRDVGKVETCSGSQARLAHGSGRNEQGLDAKMISSPTYTSGRGLRLEKVVGLSTSSSNCVDVNPSDDTEVAYHVGCVVVLYSTKTLRQRAYMRVAKPVASLRYSWDGKFLAVGEKGHNPAITVWDIQSHVKIAELKGHRFGIGAMRFSRDQRFLVSAGFEHDDQLVMWDWAKEKKLASEALEAPVQALDVNHDSSEIVTVGEQYVRFWKVSTEPKQGEGEQHHAVVDNESGDQQDDAIVQLVAHQAGLMPDYKESTFVDVVCGATAETRGNTFMVTECGSLICMGPNRLMEKWVLLEVESAHSVSLHDGKLVCGCSDGVSRVFKAASFEFVATLPFPRRLDKALCDTRAEPADAFADSDDESPESEGEYAHCLCARWSNAGNFVVAIYSDRSMFVWDFSDPGSVTQFASFMAHPAGVSGVVTIPADAAPVALREPYASSNAGATFQHAGLFVTCADDRVLRFWKLGSTKKKKGAMQRPPASSSAAALWQNAFSQELVREISLDDLPREKGVAQGPGARCVSVNPKGNLVAAGDKGGGVTVFDLATSKAAFREATLHSAEVMSIVFSPLMTFGTDTKPVQLMATASRDRLVHVFDVSVQPFAKLQTLKNHSGIVTALRFSMDGRKLLSTGGDKTIVLSDVVQDAGAKSVRLVRQKSINVPYGTISALDVDATNKYFCTTGQDKKISIWSLANGKPIRSYKPEGDSGELNLVHLDPAGMFYATGSHDKAVRLFDFYSGECIAKSAGHSEAISGLSFSTDSKRLVSCSRDGCMFVWRLAPELTAAIRERLREIKRDVAADADAAAKSSENDNDNTRNVPAEQQNKQQRLFESNNLPAWARTKPEQAAPAVEDDVQEVSLDASIATPLAPAESSSSSASPMLNGSGFRADEGSDGRDEEDEVAQIPLPNALKNPDQAPAGAHQDPLTTPRSPPAAAFGGEVKSLAQERAAMKRKEDIRDTADAVQRMRAQLKDVGILEATMERKEDTSENDKAGKFEDGERSTRDGSPPTSTPSTSLAQRQQHVAKGIHLGRHLQGLSGGGTPLSTPQLDSPAPGSNAATAVQLVAKETGSQEKASPVAPLPSSLNSAHLAGAGGQEGFVPSTPLRSAEEARRACDLALMQVHAALSNTAQVLREVEKLDDNLSESLVKTPRSDTFTTGVLETSKAHVEELMTEFRTQLSG
ncbi:WD repeat-containing protein 62, partial [Durusdinium trenchii]